MLTPASTVSHYFYPVNRLQREDLLLALLKETNFDSVMVFTRTKADADMLAARVKRDGDHKVALMHGDIPQKDRTKALLGFRTGEFEVIIATDIAARGLDISGVTHVINYSVPDNPEDYVHRIGRTGRAEKEGDAYTILSADELVSAENIERFINQSVLKATQIMPNAPWQIEREALQHPSVVAAIASVGGSNRSRRDPQQGELL